MADKTHGDLYGPAMTVVTQDEADRYLAYLIATHLQVAPGDTYERAEEVQKTNLGYYAGYYDHEVRARVERLFGCAHPIFGSIAEQGAPTPEEAFEMGRKAGEAVRAEHEAGDG